MIIMPSTPRLRTPARSVTSSPSDAMTSGVAAVMTVSIMASSMRTSRRLTPDQANAIVNERIAGKHEEQEEPLEDAADLVGNADRKLSGLAAEICQCQDEAAGDDPERVQAAEKGHDDRGKAVARRYGRLQMADRARDFGDSGKS